MPDLKQSPLRRSGHVLFFAAVPPPDIKTAMERAWQTFGTGDPFRCDKLHLSIYAVAEVDHVDPTLVKRARQAANVLRTAPFTLRFDHLTTFGGAPDHYPLVVSMDKASRGVNDIAAELHTACRKLGLTASRSSTVTPHVTLAYGAGFPEKRPLDQPITWTIDEITLIDSHQGKGRHEHLGTWPLPKDRQQQGFDF